MIAFLIHALDKNWHFSKKLKKEKGEKNAQNGQPSPTETDESGFDGWSDDLPTASKTNEDDWSTDTSAEAVRERMSKLGVGVKGLTHNQDLEKSTEQRFEIFFEFVKVIFCSNCFLSQDLMTRIQPVLGIWLAFKSPSPTQRHPSYALAQFFALITTTVIAKIYSSRIF